MIQTAVIGGNYFCSLFHERSQDWVRAGFQITGLTDGDADRDFSIGSFSPQLILTLNENSKIRAYAEQNNIHYLPLSAQSIWAGSLSNYQPPEYPPQTLLFAANWIKRLILRTIWECLEKDRPFPPDLHFPMQADGALLLLTPFPDMQAEEAEPLLSLCEEICADAGFFCAPLQNGSIGVLALSNGKRGGAERQQMLSALSSSLYLLAVQKLHAPLLIGVSDIRGDGSACRQARTILQHRFYEEGPVFFSWQLPEISQTLPKSAQVFSKALPDFIALGKTAELLEGFDHALLDMESARLSPSLVLQWIEANDRLAGISRQIDGSSFERLRTLSRAYLRVHAEITSDGQGKAITRAIAYIETHFAGPLSLGEVAEHVHLNAAYLSFLFKQETGVNFSEFLLRCRMDKACELLLTTNNKIKDIASVAGFNDYRYFCKTFKRLTGMRPQNYRKSGGSDAGAP